MSLFQELREEFRRVMGARNGGLFDGLLPLLVFLLALPLTGLQAATVLGCGLGSGVAVFRMMRKEPSKTAWSGVAGVGLAAFLVWLSGSESAAFVPGLVSGSLLVLLCLLSLLIRRPLAAWASFLTRRWPLDWYWLPVVRPAYQEVTLFWALAFGARLAADLFFYQRDAVAALGTSRLLLGWPYTVAVLVLSYIYGLRRLGHLRGPSVDEFKAGKQPPWEGQKRGF